MLQSVFKSARDRLEGGSSDMSSSENDGEDDDDDEAQSDEEGTGLRFKFKSLIGNQHACTSLSIK